MPKLSAKSHDLTDYEVISMYHSAKFINNLNNFVKKKARTFS